MGKFLRSINNPVPSLVVLVTIVGSLRFLMDGVSVTLFGHMLTVGHMESLAYSALLAPVLGAHGYMHTRGSNEAVEVSEK